MSRRSWLVAGMLAVTGMFWGLHFHGPEHFLGIDTQASPNYDFVSGAGPMIETFILQLPVIIGLLKILNCQKHGCWGWGHLPVAGGHKVCGKHFAEVTGQPRKLTTDVLRRLHHEHLERTAR